MAAEARCSIRLENHTVVRSVARDHWLAMLPAHQHYWHTNIVHAHNTEYCLLCRLLVNNKLRHISKSKWRLTKELLVQDLINYLMSESSLV